MERGQDGLGQVRSYNSRNATTKMESGEAQQDEKISDATKPRLITCRWIANVVGKDRQKLERLMAKTWSP